MLGYCCFKFKSRAGMLFFEWRRKVSVGHFTEIENRCKNIIFNLLGTEPPFRANLLFGYAKSGFERVSFSGSTVNRIARLGAGFRNGFIRGGRARLAVSRKISHFSSQI